MDISRVQENILKLPEIFLAHHVSAHPCKCPSMQVSIHSSDDLLPSLVIVLATVGHPGSNAQTLAKRSSGNINVVLTL